MQTKPDSMKVMEEANSIFKANRSNVMGKSA